jgi:hypothetical protein
VSHEKRILADGRAVLYRGDNLDLLAAGPTLPPSPFSLPGEPGEPSHAG